MTEREGREKNLYQDFRKNAEKQFNINGSSAWDLMASQNAKKYLRE